MTNWFVWHIINRHFVDQLILWAIDQKKIDQTVIANTFSVSENRGCVEYNAAPPQTASFTLNLMKFSVLVFKNEIIRMVVPERDGYTKSSMKKFGQNGSLSGFSPLTTLSRVHIGKYTTIRYSELLLFRCKSCLVWFFSNMTTAGTSKSIYNFDLDGRRNPKT